MLGHFWRWLRFAARLLGYQLWLLHRPNWRKLGRFSGLCAVEWLAPRKYRMVLDPAHPLRFERGSAPDRFAPTGEVVTVGQMLTDGGTVPMAAALIELTPFSYLPAYLVHDWLYEAHHRDGSGDFEQTNRILLEAMWTLMQTGTVPRNRFHLHLVWDGCSSPAAKEVWDQGILSLE